MTTNKDKTDVQIAVLSNEVKNLAEMMEKLDKKLDYYSANFANKADVEVAVQRCDSEREEMKVRISKLEEEARDINVIRKLVYGVAGLMLTAVIGAIVGLVIRGN